MTSRLSQFKKLIGLEKKASLAAPDDWLLSLFGAAPTLAGVTVTPQTAMTCAPVACAVRSIGEAVGQLPLFREAIALCMVLEQHASRLFGSGARPSGVLSLKGVVTPDAIAKAKTSWQAAHAGNNSGGTAVVPADATWQALTFSSVDAQFLEMSKFAIGEICRVFRVSPHMLAELDRATMKNAPLAQALG